MTRTVAVSMAAAALLAPGCGGDDEPETDKERYEREFNAVVERFEQRKPKDPDAPPSLAQLEQVKVYVLDLAGGLARIHPPAEIAAAHADFVAGIRWFGTEEIGEAAQAFRRGGMDAALETGGPEPDDAPIVARLRAARREFDAKGYDLGEISEVPQ